MGRFFLDALTLNLEPLFQGLLQAVPVWAILLSAIGYWVKKQNSFYQKQEQRWERIESRIYAMEMAIAASGLKDLKSDLDVLKRSHTEADMNIKALWRAVDPPPRASEKKT